MTPNAHLADGDSLSSRTQSLKACAITGGVMLGAIVLGHDGRRVLQLAVLALPALLWLAWPVRGAAMHHLRAIVVTAWGAAFALDGIARAYLVDTYQAAPDSSLVLGAIANSNVRESTEYLSMHWRTAVLWSGTFAVALALIARQAWRGARIAAPWPRGAVVLLCIAIALASVAYASKPWRRLHPVMFWTTWTSEVQSLRASWVDQKTTHDRDLAQAKLAAPTISFEGPATVVLVISDSVNRDNLGLYGYGRATTPRLLAHKRELGQELVVLRNAWSVDASTLPALRNIFHFGQPAAQDPQHLLALARTAGYKTWWMSNHDDIAIDQQHARLADVVEMVNRTPGRSSVSLDGELLDCVQEAIEDPAERKLIVVHLMGAHPHYSLRYPPGANPFDDDVDAVESGLVKNGRASWVREFRQQYDAALLYHDQVVAETLALTRTAGRAQEYRAWMYLSDHGQEVGHQRDQAGHSPMTAAGYRIPAVVWRNGGHGGQASLAEAQPFRADWAGWTVANLLHLNWTGSASDRDILAANYRWQAPVLPFEVASFSD